jgi:hypothetical protein
MSLACVGSSNKKQWVQNLGAKAIIVKSVEDLWKKAEEISPNGFDVIAEANGVKTLKRSYQHLSPAGKFVVYEFHTMLRRSGQRMNSFKLAWDYLRTPRFSPLRLTQKIKVFFALTYLIYLSTPKCCPKPWKISLRDGMKAKLNFCPSPNMHFKKLQKHIRI